MAFNRKMNKEIVVYLYNGIILSKEKDKLVKCNNIDEPQKHWGKEYRHKKLYIDSTCMNFKNRLHWSVVIKIQTDCLLEVEMDWKVKNRQSWLMEKRSEQCILKGVDMEWKDKRNIQYILIEGSGYMGI